MLVIIGSIVVLASVIGAFWSEGGNPLRLWIWQEYVMIIGSAAGSMMVMAPKKVIIDMMNQILGTLKDLTAIDKYLLGTKRTQEKIEELQQYLAENQVDQVTILTPERTYRVQRSKYGNRALINTTQNPRARNDLYAIAADPKQLENAQAAFESAKHAFSEHTDRKAQLQERLTHLNEAKQQKQQELTTFNEGFSGIKVLEERRDLYKQRVEVARREAIARRRVRGDRSRLCPSWPVSARRPCFHRPSCADTGRRTGTPWRCPGRTATGR